MKEGEWVELCKGLPHSGKNWWLCRIWQTKIWPNLAKVWFCQIWPKCGKIHKKIKSGFNLSNACSLVNPPPSGDIKYSICSCRAILSDSDKSLINSKPIDRKIILEDAAGTSGLQARRHESELKLLATEDNLEKIDINLNNLKDQKRDLSRQARQAEKYEQISDLLPYLV